MVFYWHFTLYFWVSAILATLTPQPCTCPQSCFHSLRKNEGTRERCSALTRLAKKRFPGRGGNLFSARKLLLACNASLWVIFCTIFGGMGYTKVRSPAQSWILTNKYTFKFEHILNWGSQTYLQPHIWPLKPFVGLWAEFYKSIFGGMGYTKVRSPAQSRNLINKDTLKFGHIVNWGHQFCLQHQFWPLRPFGGCLAIFELCLYGGCTTV